jgi:hypothetical protein
LLFVLSSKRKLEGVLRFAFAFCVLRFAFCVLRFAKRAGNGVKTQRLKAFVLFL